MALFFGLRQAEQFRLEWKNVNLDRGLLTLPATKAGGVQYVHLNDEAKRILRGSDSWQRSKLRHSNNALVRRYAHLSQAYLKSVVEAVASFGKSESAQEGQALTGTTEGTISASAYSNPT